MSNLFKSERFMFLAVIAILLGIISIVAFKTYEANALMLIPREKVEGVNTCIDNYVSCTLLYDSKEDIPL